MITEFSQFIGNTRTLEGVKAMLEARRVPQTMILEGPVGSGKKTLARLIAAGLLCGEQLPCGGCDSCRKVFFTGHPDISLVLPEKDKAQIRVEQIRTVRSDAFVRPVEGNGKVFIIGGSMNDAAQNAFLKVLEEPPAGVYFILICEHRNDLMDTVLSRGVVFSLGAVSFEEATPLLKQEGVSVTAEEFAQKGGVIGGVLQKEEMLSVAGEIALAMATALGQGSRSAFLKASAKAAEDRLYHAPVLDALYGILHGALLESALGGEQSSHRGECISLLNRRLSKARLLAMAEIVTAGQKKIIYNVNGNLFFTALCSELLPRT